MVNHKEGELIDKAKANKEVDEAKRAREAEARAKKEADRVAKETARREAEEAKARAKREADEAKRAREAETRAKKEAQLVASEAARQEADQAKARKQREADEVTKAGELEILARKEAEGDKGRAQRAVEPVATEVPVQEAESGQGPDLYEGIVKLVIVSPVAYDLIRKFEGALRRVQNLRLVLIEGSAEEGTRIIVSSDKPLPLLDLLKKIPPVEQVMKKGKDIQVRLSTSPQP